MKNLLTLDECVNEAASQFKHAVQQALQAAGYNLKQSEVKVGAKKVRGMGTKITLNGEMIGFDDDIPKMIASFTKSIEEDPGKYGLKESVNEAKDKFKVIDTKTGETIEKGLPKQIAQKLAAKKKEWTSYPDREKSAIAKIAMSEESVNEASDKRSHILLKVPERNYYNMVDKLQDMNINHSQESKNVIKVYTDPTSGWPKNERQSQKLEYKLTHDVWVDKFVVKESLNEGNPWAMEKAFKKKGITIDVQDLERDGGFFTTYDNISKDELLKIAKSVDNKWKYHVSDPIKSQETGYYLMVNFTNESVNERKVPPNDETIKFHIDSYKVDDDPYDVAKEIGSQYNWTEREIEKAEKIIRKKYIKESVNEAKEKWVVYDTKTKKRLPNAGKTWATMKAADAFAAKQKNAKVASAEFYFDKIQESVNEGKEEFVDRSGEYELFKTFRHGGMMTHIIKKDGKEIKQYAPNLKQRVAIGKFKTEFK